MEKKIHGIIFLAVILIVAGGAMWGGYRLCHIRQVRPLEEAVERAERASEILAAQVAEAAQKEADEIAAEIEGMDAHNVTITFLSPEAVSELTSTADGITKRAAQAVVEYLRGRGVSLVTVHRRGVRSRGKSRGP